jgi:hypothetical protein
MVGRLQIISACITGASSNVDALTSVVLGWPMIDRQPAYGECREGI